MSVNLVLMSNNGYVFEQSESRYQYRYAEQVPLNLSLTEGERGLPLVDQLDSLE